MIELTRAGNSAGRSPARLYTGAAPDPQVLPGRGPDRGDGPWPELCTMARWVSRYRAILVAERTNMSPSSSRLPILTAALALTHLSASVGTAPGGDPSVPPDGGSLTCT